MVQASNSTAAALPRPTQDIEQAKLDIKEHGLCLVDSVLAPAKLHEARQALYRAAVADRARNWEQKFALDYAHDESNQRVWNLLSRDPVFGDLAEHPLALELVRHVIDWPALLGNISANITGPGGGEMVLHADQIFVSEPWPSEPQGVNVAWCLDDFTEENGATCVVPGSHQFHRNPRQDENILPVRPVVAPAGTMIVVESRVWHRTGLNRTTDQHRAGVFAWYTRPIYRAQENWFLSLNPAIRQFASDNMLVLLGYRTVGLGLVNGRSPA
jgi:ectoine hydroxylase-related dioxygenase (phytanoyl-CoA dioxygenase family)